MELRLSNIWKERLYDLVKYIAILLTFHIIMFAISGDPLKYDILAIIPWEAGVVLFCIILLAEKQRSTDYKIEQLVDEYNRIKKS